MADFDASLVPLGRAGTGAAVVFGPTTDGLGALRYLEKTDQLDRARKDRAQAAAQRQKDAGFKDFQRYQKLASDTGVHFVPQLQASAQQTRDAMLKIAADTTMTREQKAAGYQELADKHELVAKAGTQADKYLLDTGQQVRTDERYNYNKAQELLYDKLYLHNEDGTVKMGEDGKPAQVAALDFDPRAAQQALSQGNGHLVGNKVYGHFLENIPENSVTYSREALPGGRGYKQVAKSDIYELTPEGKLRRDPATNHPVLRDAPETLAAFDSDALSKQWLDGQVQQHRQLVGQATEKLHRNEVLTPAEAEAVKLETAPAGVRMELFKKDLMRYGYGREETAVLQKPARVDRASGARAQSPKYTRTGGTEYLPEVISRTGTGGVLSLASSDPVQRVKADGTQQQFTGRNVHRRYLLAQNGQAVRQVVDNAVPQDLTYLKPQLLLTHPDGNVVSPTDPTLEQRFQQGDKQPLLNWIRQQREAHPQLALKYHFQAVPTKDKLTAESHTQAIYQRLVAERDKAHLQTGQAGYHSDDDLRNTAQRLASQEGAQLLIPYEGADKGAIDAATEYLFRDKSRKQRMQQQLDYFNRESAPRPAEQRAAPKKLGIDFGTKPAAPASKATSPAAPSYKPAGTKPTGIKFF